MFLQLQNIGTGGSCNRNMYAFQVDMVKMKVVKTEIHNGRLTFAGEETVVMEKHNTCVCDCRIKEQVQLLLM